MERARVRERKEEKESEGDLGRRIGLLVAAVMSKFGVGARSRRDVPIGRVQATGGGGRSAVRRVRLLDCRFGGREWV